MRADELDLQFALTPFLRGTWQAEEMRLAAPQLTAAPRARTDACRRRRSPRASIRIAQRRPAADRRRHTDAGRRDRRSARSRPVLQRPRPLAVRSVRWQRRVHARRRELQIEIAVRLVRRQRQRQLHVRAAVQPGEHPYRIETDGKIAFNEGKPRFRAIWRSRRSPGLERKARRGICAARSPRARTFGAAGATQFVYGADKRPSKLTGLVRLDMQNRRRLGRTERAAARPRPHARRQGRQQAGPRRGSAADGTGERAARVPLVDSRSTVGVQRRRSRARRRFAMELAGDLKSTKDGWQLEPLEFRAPGFSKVALSGATERSATRRSRFTGPCRCERGRSECAVRVAGRPRRSFRPSDARPLTVRRHVTLGTENRARRPPGDGRAASR